MSKKISRELTYNKKLVPIETIKGHKYSLRCLSWNNQIIGSSSEIILTHDINKSKAHINKFDGHKDKIFHISFIQDKKNILFSCSNDKKCILWNTKSGKLLEEIKITNTPIVCCVSNDGTILVIGDDINIISFYDISKISKDPFKSIEYDHKIRSINFVPCGKFFLVSDNQGVTSIFCSFTFKLLRKIQAHTTIINDLEMNEKNFFQCSDDGTVSIWDVNNLFCKQNFQFDNEHEPISTISSNKNGKYFCGNSVWANYDSASSFGDRRDLFVRTKTQYLFICDISGNILLKKKINSHLKKNNLVWNKILKENLIAYSNDNEIVVLSYR